ncbi:CHAT domain-containing protein [Mycena pura]|uniref:CHAT domain-containing protein n=1 Tax=Mycena pura TaxID=153505 RepID=A0AAD6UL64_9AGAR|nr:CHAT domain-containing protein [Mycena pura]
MQQLVQQTEGPELPKDQFKLGNAYRLQYQNSGDIKLLEAALEHLGKAISLAPHNKAGTLGNLDDLEAALQNFQATMDLMPESHPDKARHLQNFGAAYSDRYLRHGDPKDLKKAVQYQQTAVDLERILYLNSLAMAYRNQYLRLGDINDLEAALLQFQKAVNLTSDGHPYRAICLQNLASVHGDRFQRLGDLTDLEATLQHFQTMAADVTDIPEGHPYRAMPLQGLATAYNDRYQRLGNLNDLEAALEHFQTAAHLTPDDHPQKAEHLHGLADAYRDRYRRLGDLYDLEAALNNFKIAADITPKGHANKAVYIRGLAAAYRDQYQRLNNLNDLQESLQQCQMVVDLTPEGHPNRAVSLQNLAATYGDQYKKLGNPIDLEAALQYFQAAVSLTPEGHPNRAAYLQGLGAAYRDRYQRLDDINDLETALQHLQTAVDLIPEGHSRRAEYLQNFAIHLMIKYSKFKQPQELETIHTAFKTSLNITSSTPEISWKNLQRWASFAAQFQPEHCISAFRGAFQLLPELLWIGHSIPVRHNSIRRLQLAQATATATRSCINLLDLPSAVEIMEQGLGTIYQQMLQLKTAVDDLPSEQAQAFQHLSNELYSKGSDPSMSLVNRRNDLIEAIRKQPDFEYFLLPKPYNVLSKASQGGPVIILNSHNDGCDAIIILSSAEPVHVLLDVTLKELESQKRVLQQLLGQSFYALLTWLWTGVVSPIYKMLEIHNIHDGRLWWLPTGVFTGLPLHACAPTDQFIHSYTATLGSLSDAYFKNIPSPVKVGVTGVTDTGSGDRPLPGVGQEVENMSSVVPLSQWECLHDEEATVDAVKLQLEHCSWVHLACHGTQNLAEPTKSHLLLYGGNLELETILKMPLSNAQVVFLAACQTAKGDPELVNESIHLSGGFIAAGFRGAIGTLWSMNDHDGPLVAKYFYSHLFRNGRQPQASDAAEALHFAVKELRRQDVPHERWVPFIHLGI